MYACFSRLLGHPTHATYNLALLASAEAAALQQGKEIHRLLTENNIPLDLLLGTSLVNMYAKSGDLSAADQVNKLLSQQN